LKKIRRAFAVTHPNQLNQQRNIANLDDNHSLKQGIWAYFLLLIFEGALRKWILPDLSSALLFIRDPIAMWLIYSAWQKNLLPSSIYLSGMMLLGVIGAFFAVFVGHGNILVAMYGARIFLFHYPLIFVIGRVFTREDVVKMGKATLLIAIPMAILIGIQFRSPQAAWVNRGIGGDLKGAGFGGVGDFFRPPGTFSFTLGTTLFFGFLAPFVFYFWLNPNKINRAVLWAATVAMLASIPFSISRTLLFYIVLTMAFTVLATVRKPKYAGKIAGAIVVGLIVLAVLSQTRAFKTATGAFTDRFNTANTAEGGLVKGVIGDRFFGGLISAFTNSSTQPILGYGLGMGTNVGAQLLTGSNKVFLISELEWGRLIGEMGPILGSLAILLRLGLAFKLALASYRRLVLGDLLPWLLLSFGFIVLAQGGWGQPTSLGFCVMIGGLMIASLQSTELES
jgi:hypothetical protein